MRVKATELLKLEDVPKDHRSWMQKVISPINDVFTQTIKIINDGLIFADNFVGKDILFSFTYQSETITFPQLYAWPLLVKPLALQVVSATEDGSPIIAAVAWQFNTDRKIELTSVIKFSASDLEDSTTAVIATATPSRLTANSKYQIRVRVTP